jgi:hypothetical protein
MTADNRIKEQGRLFRDLARHYRGRAVTPPGQVPPSPRRRTSEATWSRLLEWMNR